jgi:hypothetical protein
MEMKSGSRGQGGIGYSNVALGTMLPGMIRFTGFPVAGFTTEVCPGWQRRSAFSAVLLDSSSGAFNDDAQHKSRGLFTAPC